MSYEINVACPAEIPAAYLLLTGQASIKSLVGDSVLGTPMFLVARKEGELCSAAAIENRSPGLFSIVLPLAASAELDLRKDLLRSAVRTAADIPKRATVFLLERTDPLGEQLASELGFERAANIAFLTCDVSRSLAPAAQRVVDFCPSGDDELTEVIAATLVRSLDCPVMVGVVGAEEMVIGFADRAADKDRYWRVATQEDRLVGCLLVHEAAEADELELMYMGVVPEARGRGVGRALVAETLSHAKRRRIGRVVLAVDEANTPAIRIYREAGFAGLSRRVMWFASATNVRRG